MKTHTHVRTLLLAVLLTVTVPALVGAQEMRVVSGTVTIANDLVPLAGVQVTVKGTVVGTLTNGDGVFNFRVPSNARTLVFTYLGYKTIEMPVDGRVEVSLEQQAIGLEGIVVTALGARREKRSLGYSVQDVTGAELTKVPEYNLVNSLQGQVAGVN